LPQARFQALVAAYNNTPRKCLDWRTPAETFSQVLHFECESTFPLARGRQMRNGTTATRFREDHRARSAFP
jgi:transposase, IS30 family